MSTLSVLFIEDDEIDQMAFRYLVKEEHLDYAYTIAVSVAAATELLSRQHFDIIIADFHLGDGTAFDILKIREDTPAIIVTGAGNETVAVAAMKAGASDYLTKDSQRSYLTLLPIVVENTIHHREIERQAGEMLKERIRREALQKFIHDASHDLRTPLTAFGTSLYLLNRYAKQLEENSQKPGRGVDANVVYDISRKMAERCDLLAQHKTHLEHIIQDMLEMARLDDINTLGPEEVLFDRLLIEAIEAHQDAARQKSITLTLTRSPRSATLRGSAAELGVMVRKLVDNAVLYTPEGGSIAASTAFQDQEVVFALADTGIGIAPEDLPHIFDRFYRVDAARRMSPHTGSGLGLAIVKYIVELHGGRIEVESILGQGTTFRVFLPLLTDQAHS
ncbi:MAG: response regulator [Chloroflexi bacterium]|nr:response regulator [Chloroflexota bacterium]